MGEHSIQADNGKCQRQKAKDPNRAPVASAGKMSVTELHCPEANNPKPNCVQGRTRGHLHDHSQPFNLVFEVFRER